MGPMRFPPNERPRPSHRRRQLTQILFNNPFEFALSLVLMILGARSLFFDETAPQSIAAQPTLLTLTFILMSIVGGAATIVGLLVGKWAPGFEQAGLYLSAAAWASYTTGLIGQIESPRAGLLLGAFVALSVACVLRAWALRREEHAKLSALRTLGGGDT